MTKSLLMNSSPGPQTIAQRVTIPPVRRPARRTLLIAGTALAVLVVVFVTVLPIVVRKIAVDKLSQMTGRAVALVDVDLNLFTGRLVLHRFRLAQKGSDAPAVEI